MTVDLSRLPAPDVVEALDFEAILGEVMRALKARDSEFGAWVESEPAIKLAEAFAYRELLLRQDMNDKCRSMMLAFAAGGDLEHLAALLGVERQKTHPGDPSARPPVLPTWEGDERMRRRTQLAVEGMATAGSAEAYRFHALKADARVRDVSVESPVPGEVAVTVLADGGDGSDPGDLAATVQAALRQSHVRPLTDVVTVAGADIVEYEISAALTVESGPDAGTVRAAAEAAARAYAAEVHRLGATVARSRLYAELHVAGVKNVTLTKPADDVAAAAAQAPFAADVAVEMAA